MTGSLRFKGWNGAEARARVGGRHARTEYAERGRVRTPTARSLMHNATFICCARSQRRDATGRESRAIERVCEGSGCAGSRMLLHGSLPAVFDKQAISRVPWSRPLVRSERRRRSRWRVPAQRFRSRPCLLLLLSFPRLPYSCWYNSLVRLTTLFSTTFVSR